MKKYNFSFIRLLTVLTLTGILISCNDKAPSPDKQEGTMKTSRENVLKNWRDMGFGMFIHWGAYTELKGRWKGQELTKDLWGEWIMKRAGIPIPEYEKAIKPFNPSKFDAAHWVELAKNAGMKYMVITAKHHDGFAMYPSDASQYNLRDFCGFRRDPMKELSEECRKQDMAFGFYYSHRIDWHAKGADKYMGNDTTATFDDYWKRKCLPQVTELTTRYGQLAVMWFDLGGSLPLEKAEELRGLVLKNQPECVISSRIGAGQGDYKSQKDRFVPLAPIIEPWETPMTLNNHWAWYPQDTDYKNARDLIRMLIAVRSMGGNLLLNIGPDNTGQIPAVETVVLKQVGKWMKKYGDAIYGISPSPLPSFPWGRCTMKGNKLYLHVFDWPADGTLFVPGIISGVTAVYPMGSPEDRSISFTPSSKGIELKINSGSLKAGSYDPDATVLVMETELPLKITNERMLDHDFDNVFKSVSAELDEPLKVKKKRYKPVLFNPPIQVHKFVSAITGFTKNKQASWKFSNEKDDHFYIAVEYGLDPSLTREPVNMQLSSGKQVVDFKLEPTASVFQDKYKKVVVGSFPISAGENKEIKLSLTGTAKADGLEIVSVTLIPSHLR
jgi:alpha-L-fucosidase